MIQLTTPDLVFNVDVDLTQAQKVSLVFRQYGDNLWICNKSDLQITPTQILYTIPADKSKLLRPAELLLQIRARTQEGRDIACPILYTKVAPILDQSIW